MVRFAYSEQYFYTLPDNHKFPITKYQLVKEQLLYEGSIVPEQLIDPGLVEEEDVLRVHTREYWEMILSLSLPQKMIRRIGLPLNETSRGRSRNSVAGTMKAAQWALESGVGINLAGGTHHAYADRGEGFSLLNDMAVTARHLLYHRQVAQILFIDLDVHQGNGNAVLFQGEPSVFTFSMHGQDNYPIPKEVSDLDVGMPTGTGDEEYLSTLEYHLDRLFAELQPELVIYQSGVDVLATDKLGKLSLTRSGCKARDEAVIGRCHSLSIPLVMVMGGGYSPSMVDLVEAHANTFRMALQYYQLG
ncbi:MAG TPA: histone deacetylase [Cytophagales bacterium]|nr:histone deacetylase [Cytophagales bacterium]HAP64962.1 histone deacetylase [Cytophagales bacterium]